MGFWLGTLVFFIFQVITTLCINFFSPAQKKGLNHILGFTACFQLWLIWAIIYIAQMHPLIVPEFKE